MIQSRRTINGQITQHLVPLLPGFPDYDLKDLQWSGGPIDMIVWNGLEEAKSAGYPKDAEVEVVFLEIKTGTRPLDNSQKLIRAAIEADPPRVRFHLHRFSPDAAAVTAVTVTASSCTEPAIGSASSEEDEERGIASDEGLGEMDPDDEPEPSESESLSSKLLLPGPGEPVAAWDSEEAAATWPVIKADLPDQTAMP